MLPILIKIGSFTLHTYGLMLALGMFIAFEYVLRSSRKFNLSEKLVTDLFFYALLFGLIGGRLFYVMTNWQAYSKNLIDVLKVWEGGMVFFGGAICAVIAGIIYCRVKKVDFWFVADVFAPAIPLAHVFGRLGCFFAGCCYGKICYLPWAVTFKNPEGLAPLNQPVHPTQMYEAFVNLLIFLVLFFLGRVKHSVGKVFLLYILLYSAARFTIEFLRGDERGVFLWGYSPAQAISFILFISVIIFWIIRYKNERTNG